MTQVKSGETITLYVETYNAMPTPEEQASAGVDDEFFLLSKHPRRTGTGSIVRACYGEQREENWHSNPDSSELRVTVKPGENTLGFFMLLGNSRYTIGRIYCRLPDGAIEDVGSATVDHPWGWLTIEGT